MRGVNIHLTEPAVVLRGRVRRHFEISSSFFLRHRDDGVAWTRAIEAPPPILKARGGSKRRFT